MVLKLENNFIFVGLNAKEEQIILNICSSLSSKNLGLIMVPRLVWNYVA